jgi:Protein of unknown function (DUF2971)
VKSIPANGPRPPRLLYHYTKADGLVSILSSQTLWATDYRFLNDSTELTYARELFEAALAQRIHRARSRDVRNGLSRLQAVMDLVADPSLLVACFCEHGDLLSQWRGYAAGSGYSIGFSTNDWANQDDGPAQFPTRLARVVYGRARQLREIDGFLTRLSGALRGVKGGTVPMRNKQIVAAILSHTAELAGLLIRLKHPAFEAEHEWRVIALVGEAQPGDLSYRPSAIGPIPYVPLRLRNRRGTYADRLPIALVTSGPNPHRETTNLGLRGLLDNYGYPRSKVFGSKIPFRVW